MTELKLNNNMQEINEEDINGGVSYTKLIGGAIGLGIVSPICGVFGGPAGFGVAFAGSTGMLISGLD